MSLNEFDIIKNYFTRQSKQATVAYGVGDDCAIVSPNSGKQLLMSMDTLVSGVHFPENAQPYQIATRALCTSLSDLAAMGAKPLWFTLGLSVPEVSKSWLNSFSEGLFFIADQYNVDLIGGDTTRGHLTITIQVHGEVESGKALKRSDAKEGDTVFVTGCLGDGAAALEMLQGDCFADSQIKEYLLSRFYQPAPQIEAGLLLADVVNAAIDVSDGLLADAGHIAHSSDVSMIINIEDIPLAPCIRDDQKCELDQHLRWALSGGDDYQLLFTVAKEQLLQVRRLCAEGMLSATEIGYIATPADQCSGEAGVKCLQQGKLYSPPEITDKGYQHFAS